MILTHSKKFDVLFYHEKNPQVRYVIVTGGRFSSKSYTVSKSICRLVNDIGHRVLYCRYTLASASDSIIPEFKEKIDLLGLSDFYEQKADRITGICNNRKIVFKGIKTSAGNQSAKLKSLKDFSIFVLDEAEEENDESSFDKIDLSIRANDVPNISVLVFNPPTKEHWTYKRFFESKGIDETFNGIIGNTAYIHTTYLDCIDYVPKDYMAVIEDLKFKDPKKYKHIIEGRYLDKADGVIFENWAYGEFDETLPFGFGMDFGFFPDPDVLIKVAIDNKRKLLYVSEAWSSFKATPNELKEKVKELTNGNLIVADSAEPRLIDDIKKYGCNIKAVSKTTIEEGIRLMREYKIIVDSKSVEIGKELNNYCEKDGKPIDSYNHRLDAIRYYLTNMHYNYKPKPLKIIGR